MKILVLVAHPALKYSRVNRAWANRLQQYPEITVYNLYDKYPHGIIDIYKEQELLLSHDRIVFQYPLFFFNVPYMLKKWQDEVLSFVQSGPYASKLCGKEIMLAVSIGLPRETYQRDGFHKFTMEELTRPQQALANLLGMVYLPGFYFYNANEATQEEIEESARKLAEHILDPSYVALSME